MSQARSTPATCLAATAEPMNHAPHRLARFLARAWWVAVLGVLVLALLPGQHLKHPVFDWSDKAQHALAFAVLALWGWHCWPHRSRWVWWGLLGLGACIEWLQHMTGWRQGEWLDLLADAAGLAVAGLLSKTFGRRGGLPQNPSSP